MNKVIVLLQPILFAAAEVPPSVSNVVEEVIQKERLIHQILLAVVPVLSGILELVGISIIAIGSVRAIKTFIASKFDFSDEEVKLDFAQSLALSLEFKLGAEVLKSVIVRDAEEFVLLFATVVLRVILTFVIHWEIKTTHEDKKLKEQELETMIEQDKQEKNGE